MPSPLHMAYLTGNFPQATHTFFWREISALRDLGVKVEIVSTTRPHLEPHDDRWRHDAVAQTAYLLPMTAGGAMAALSGLWRAGPRGWWRVWRSWRRFDGDARSRLWLVPAIVLGARLAVMARRRGWQHVHVGFTENAANIALYANRLAGVSYSVNQGHTIRASGPNQPEKWRHAAFGAVVSEHLLREVRDVLGSEVPRHVSVIRHGLDLTVFRRRRPYQPWRGSGAVRIVSVGRLIPSKGHSDVLEAVGMLHRRGLLCELRIAGDDATADRRYSAELYDRAEQLGLETSLQLLGPLPEAAVREELEQAHLFVLATHHEGWGCAIAEAMAMGVPVVATAVGGVPEIVSHTVDGLLVNPRDPAGVADAVEGIVREPDTALRFSGAARRKIESKYDRLVGPDMLKQCVIAALGREAGDDEAAGAMVAGGGVR